MQGEHSTQSSFFALIYERLALPDHLLRRRTATVDFAYVTDLVRDCYCPDTGRPSWDPLMLFKTVSLQFLYELSDRRVEAPVNLHLARKGLVGLRPDEKGPGHTALTCFRARLGAEKFQAIFNEVDPRAEEVTADKGFDTDEKHHHLRASGQRSSLLFKRNRTNPEALGQADPDNQRERSSIERKFAQQKRDHGLRQAHYWGLTKVTIQALVTCILVNCKRIATLWEVSCSPPRARLCPANDTGR